MLKPLAEEVSPAVLVHVGEMLVVLPSTYKVYPVLDTARVIMCQVLAVRSIRGCWRWCSTSCYRCYWGFLLGTGCCAVPPEVTVEIDAVIICALMREPPEFVAEMLTQHEMVYAPLTAKEEE